MSRRQCITHEDNMFYKKPTEEKVGPLLSHTCTFLAGFVVAIWTFNIISGYAS